MYGKEQINFLRNKNYLVGDETIEERFDSIVNIVKNYEEKYSKGLGERIRGYLQQQILCPSTPQLSNLGRIGRHNTRDLPCSCNIITVPNSISGIYYSLGETAMLSKLGAGVGADFTEVVEKDTPLEEGIFSNSKLDWVDLVVKTAQSVSQGCYDEQTEIWTEKGFFKFKDLPKDVRVLQVDDMDEKEYSFVEPTETYEYEVDEELYRFTHSKIDLLVTGNHRIVTYKDGEVLIEEAKDFKPELGKRFYAYNKFVESLEVKIEKEHYKGKVYCVEVPSGVIVVRRNEKIVNCGNSNRRGYSVPFLSIEDKEFYDIMKRAHKANPDKKDPLVNNNIGIILPKGFNDKIKTDKELQKRFLEVLKVRQSDGKVYLVHIDNLNKNQSPVYEKLNHTVSATNICCVSGNQLVATKDGIKTVEELSNQGHNLELFDNDEVRKSSPMLLRSEKDALFRITLMNGLSHEVTFNHKILTADGMKSIETGLEVGDIAITQTKKGIFGKNSFKYSIGQARPSDFFDCTEEEQKRFIDYSFSHHGGRYYGSPKALNDMQVLCLNNAISTYKKGDYLILSKKGNTISSIEYIGAGKTYCPTVDSEKHLWVCNGFVTSNSEAVTPHYDDKTFCCMLTSLNLVHWDKIKENKQIIKDAYMFLDITVEEYIRLTENIPFLEKARRSAIEKRDIGLGTLGFHDYIQSKGSAYGDLISRRLNREIFKTIREVGEEVTKEMAEKLGSPKMCEEAGMVRRNVSLMMVAPNKSCMTLETNLLGENDEVMNFYELTEKGGIDINEQLEVTIVYEDGTEHTCHYNDTIDGVKVSDLILEHNLEEV